jgi:hypothetical protein
MGAYFVDSQFCEKAIQYFERAAAVQFENIMMLYVAIKCNLFDIGPTRSSGA